MAEDSIFSPSKNKKSNKLDYYIGFSENLYGNNWFVLSTNEGLQEGHDSEAMLNPQYSTICGILDDVPELSFSTTISDGPQKTATDLLVNTFSVSNDGSGSLLGAVGSATGANMSKQLAGGYTAKIVSSKQLDGEFDLSFTVWKRPSELFDSTCYPSDQSEVIRYLTRFATVDATSTIVKMIDHNVDQAITGIASVLPIAKKAVGEAGKVMFGSDNDNQDLGFLGTIDRAVEAMSRGADEALARGWSDRQRITLGKQKFNESLHRLDILRAGVLGTYLIVAIKDWSYQLDQDSLGEKMTVKITCKLDQRISSSKLKLYSETKDLPVE